MSTIVSRFLFLIGLAFSFGAVFHLSDSFVRYGRKASGTVCKSGLLLNMESARHVVDIAASFESYPTTQWPEPLRLLFGALIWRGNLGTGVFTGTAELHLEWGKAWMAKG